MLFVSMKIACFQCSKSRDFQIESFGWHYTCVRIETRKQTRQARFCLLMYSSRPNKINFVISINCALNFKQFIRLSLSSTWNQLSRKQFQLHNYQCLKMQAVIIVRGIEKFINIRQGAIKNRNKSTLLLLVIQFLSEI